MALPTTFSFSHIMAHPKEMPTHEQNGLEYTILKANGFIKLFTLKGRVYWSAQAMNHQRLPDWKIHFSIADESIPVAWNIIADLFLESACAFGMKLKDQIFSPVMRGREITVYIYRYQPEYDAYHEEGPLTPLDERGPQFWNRFIRTAEERLAAHQVKSLGTADGDLPLGGDYASLRNEAFVKYDPNWNVSIDDLRGFVNVDRGVEGLEDQEMYPPNAAGYNAAGHTNNPLTKRSKFSKLIRWMTAKLS